MVDTVDAASGGVVGTCVPIPYCYLHVQDVPGCKHGRAKLGGTCNSNFRIPLSEGRTVDLESFEACSGFKAGFSKGKDNGWLWVYVWDSAGSVVGTGIFDSCKDPDTLGRFCSVTGGGCHQLGDP
jgi:hypothetical protein